MSAAERGVFLSCRECGRVDEVDQLRLDALLAERPDTADVCGGCLEEYTAGLRRRREAAWRLPPLESGRRDPWEDR